MKRRLARVLRSQFARDVAFSTFLAATAAWLVAVYVLTPYQ